MNNNSDTFKILDEIAWRHMRIETLATRNNDRHDFHDVSVWGVKAALEAAFNAGREAASKEAQS